MRRDHVIAAARILGTTPAVFARGGTGDKKTLNEMICEALEGVGGVAYLIQQAEKNPRAFLSLVAKVIPPQAVQNEPVVQVVRWARTDEEATPDPSRWGRVRTTASDGSER